MTIYKIELEKILLVFGNGIGSGDLWTVNLDKEENILSFDIELGKVNIDIELADIFEVKEFKIDLEEEDMWSADIIGTTLVIAKNEGEDDDYN